MHDLLTHPGASRFVLDIQVPYSREAMKEYLKKPPESYCSEDTARKMAEIALENGIHIADRALGIACTAALRTLNERADADRAFLCVCSRERMFCKAIHLKPDTRQAQDEVVSDALLSLIARFVGE